MAVACCVRCGTGGHDFFLLRESVKSSTIPTIALLKIKKTQQILQRLLHIIIIIRIPVVRLPQKNCYGPMTTTRRRVMMIASSRCRAGDNRLVKSH